MERGVKKTTDSTKHKNCANIYAITDEHLQMHCTGLAPAPAYAPAHAHSTLIIHTHRSALSQGLVVRYHERQKAIRRHDEE